MMMNVGPNRSPTSVSLPNATYIGDTALGYCGNLTSVTLPSVVEIGYMAFAYCNSLTSVTLGSDFTTVDSMSFYNCSSLTDVYVEKTISEMQNMLNGSLWGLGVTYDDSAYPQEPTPIYHEVTIHCTNGNIVISNGEATANAN